MQMLWPIIMVVLANTVYHVCAKSTADGLNPFFSLVITYGIGAVISLILFFISSPNKNISFEFSKTNWATFALGICIVALEFGYLNVYRSGWNINTASLVANICLAVVLLFVGAFAFKEELTPRKIAGVLVCAAGLVIIGK